MFRKNLNFLTPNFHEFCTNIQMPYFPAPYLSAFFGYGYVMYGKSNKCEHKL